MLQAKWRITLMNGLAVSGNGRQFERFRGQTTGELLALLVLNSHRVMTREEIAGIIWPDSPVSAGRASLRTALSDIRAVLVPIGTPAGTILNCDRVSVRLMPESFPRDVLDVKSACVQSARAGLNGPVDAPARAVEAYAGELLPGSYADWIVVERGELNLTYTRQLSQLIHRQRSECKFAEAIPHLQEALRENPYDDALVILAMETCLAAGSGHDAIACHDRHEVALRVDFGTTVSAAVHELVERARALINDSAVSSDPSMDMDRSVTNVQLSGALMGGTGQSVAGGDTIGVPLLLTRSFGRRSDISTIADMISPERSADDAGPRRRLLTITGPAGAGKTRLAAEVAAEIASRGMDVCFVPLAEVTQVWPMLEEIARMLDLSQSETSALLSDLSNRLSIRPTLLVLDNFEQLLPGLEASIRVAGRGPSDVRNAPEAVCSLLQAARGLTCLVTSRQVLRITGEQEHALEPLSFPTKDDILATIQQFDSVRLFEDRARLAKPSFRLTPQNAPIVAGICERLDGLPLSIELAAAWVSTLTPTQILHRVTNGLDLLVGRKRDRHDRHKSLKAALDWSFELLPPKQRSALTGLTVFTAGWDADAAAWVCKDADTIESIASLHDRSLVVADSSVHTDSCIPRYRFLETIRTYAAARLDKNEEPILRRRHLAWFDQLALEAYGHWCTQDEDAWFRRIALDLQNIVAALEFGLTDSPPSVRIGMSILTNLGHFWLVRAQYSDIESLFSRYLAHEHAQRPDKLRRRLCYSAAGLACLRQDYRAAETLYLENLAIARQPHQPADGGIHVGLGSVAAWFGDNSRARACYQDAMRTFTRSGSMRGVAVVYGALGELYMGEQSYTKALPDLAKAVEMMQTSGNLTGSTHHRKLLGLCYARVGDFRNAGECLNRSIGGYLSLMDLRGLAELLVQLVEVYPVTAKSARLLGAAAAIKTSISASLHTNAVSSYVRSAMDELQFDGEWHLGLKMSISEAAEYAMEVLQEASHEIMPHSSFHSGRFLAPVTHQPTFSCPQNYRGLIPPTKCANTVDRLGPLADFS